MRHRQLRTRPPTDDAVLRGHATIPDRRHAGQSDESSRPGGTLIHHAAAGPIRPLPVSMIEPTFRTLLVTPTRGADTGASGLAAAWRRAVDVSPIAGRTNSEGLGARTARAHPKRRLHEAAAPSVRPRSAPAISGRMSSDWFGLPQRRVGHEGLERSLQVLTLRSAAHTLSQPRPASYRLRPTASLVSG